MVVACYVVVALRYVQVVQVMSRGVRGGGKREREVDALSSLALLLPLPLPIASALETHCIAIGNISQTMSITTLDHNPAPLPPLSLHQPTSPPACLCSLPSELKSLILRHCHDQDKAYRDRIRRESKTRDELKLKLDRQYPWGWSLGRLARVSREFWDLAAPFLFSVS